MRKTSQLTAIQSVKCVQNVAQDEILLDAKLYATASPVVRFSCLYVL